MLAAQAALAGLGAAPSHVAANAPAAASAAGTTNAAPPATGPAGQVGPALVALAAAPDGRHSVSLRLTPPTLGTVQITLARNAAGPAQVEIRADRPETLALLVHAQDQLHSALDQAGVPAAGRSLHFQLDSGAGGQSQGSAARPGAARGANLAATEDAGAFAPAPPIPAPRFLRAGIDITA